MPEKPAAPARHRDDLATYVVADGQTLVHHRKSYKAGTVVSLQKSDAEALVASGVLKSK